MFLVECAQVKHRMSNCKTHALQFSRYNSAECPFSVTQEQFPTMNKFLPYPFLLLFSIIAFNTTAFTVLLQMDFLMFNATIFKVIAWLATAGAWALAYIFRNK
jgi:hypothetical protein